MNFSPFFLKKIYTVAFLFLLILVVLDLLAFFYFPQTLLSDLFIATKEQTPLTWLSSLAMFLLALASLNIYYQSGKRAWYFLSAIFFFFSIDDATYLHERISGSVQRSTELLGFFPSYIWVLLYLPLLVFSLGALMHLLWKKRQHQSRRWVVSALVLLGSAFLLDFLDGITQKDPSVVFCLDTNCHMIVLHLMRLTEEIFEASAIGILGYALILEYCCNLPEALTSSAQESTVGADMRK